MQVEQLEVLASNMVGDSGSPNVFFVSVKGIIVLVTTDFDAAHDYWAYLSRHIETALEDRKTGVLSSTEPIDEGSTELATYDDAHRLLGRTRL